MQPEGQALIDHSPLPPPRLCRIAGGSRELLVGRLGAVTDGDDLNPVRAYPISDNVWPNDDELPKIAHRSAALGELGETFAGAPQPLRHSLHRQGFEQADIAADRFQ